MPYLNQQYHMLPYLHKQEAVYRPTPETFYTHTQRERETLNITSKENNKYRSQHLQTLVTQDPPYLHDLITTALLFLPSHNSFRAKVSHCPFRP